MSRRESIGRARTASQSDSSEPTMKIVTVAVLPPRLPPGMAPPTGIGAADAFSWDEAINWQHNSSMNQEQPGRRKSFMRKVGLTTQRKRAGEEDDLPPFVMRQVPYDTWRKHYAKDKDGNYRGLLAPAQDCLLKPEDVQKWRADDPVTFGDKWTRGQHALPVYAEAGAEQPAPEYQIDAPSHEQPMSYETATATATASGPVNSNLSEAWDGSDTTRNPQIRQMSNSISQPIPATQSTGQTIIDDKTAAQIIAEAKAKPKPKMTLKETLSKGATMAMMGN